MNRNTILLFCSAAVLLIIVVGLAISLSFGGSSKNETKSQINGGVYGTPQTSPNATSNPATPTSTTANSATFGAVTVYKPVAGWQLAQNNSLKVSLKVPAEWDISGDSSKYSFKAAWNTERVEMGADIYSYDNPDKITPSEWAQKSGLKSFAATIVGGVSGVRYTTKIAYEQIFDEDPSELDDSYIVGLILPQGGKIIDASCFVSGTDYALYKSKCDEIINTFSFIK